MGARHLGAALLVVAMGGGLAAQRSGGSAASRPIKVTRVATCASDLGLGVKTKRRFCDVVIAPTGIGSVAMAIPAHTGAATLLFDLHPRIQLQYGVTDPVEAFVRNSAVVAVVRSMGDVIDRAGVVGEYRTPADLFDRVAGSGPEGLKAVAPGKGEPIRVTIPAGITAIGIVGIRQEVVTARLPLGAAFDAPGKPVAIVSNLRIEYR
jgi:hypothetical protein